MLETGSRGYSPPVMCNDPCTATRSAFHERHLSTARAHWGGMLMVPNRLHFIVEVEIQPPACAKLADDIQGTAFALDFFHA
ncbi:hypothetical protein RGR602_CH01858 [Rhizobium gallicum bv. gallicum R602sp]|uniref:Uncharacterized protein n=1 Tax=Rhizobium gallicum bv. gallicum R602sp TaxID=1041138 RepID=A0A0B4WZS6_9HYPH|nr:hypothetical protein RGR602_CH01858 [Rhizobium gallicum bv. gallicum R602sp]